MEYFDENYLQHHGVKGQKWGRRRYQNPDGTLTEAGKKRYNKEMEKLKAEEKQIKAEQKVLSNKKKTQAKIDKLDAKKADLENKRKALKEEQDKMAAEEKAAKGKKDKSKPDNQKVEESVEDKRAKLLKSNDPKELYENRDLLTTAEINERLNRIDTERRLAAVAESTKVTGMQRVDKALKTFKKVDEVYTTLDRSGVGGLVKKKLGIGEKENKEVNINEFYKNINKKSNQEVADMAKRTVNEGIIKKSLDEAAKKKQQEATEANAKKEQAQKAAEAKKQVDDYNERWAKGEFDNYHKKGSDITDAKYDSNADRVERVTGEIVDDVEFDAVRNGQRYVSALLDGPVVRQYADVGRLLLEEAIK